MMPNQRHDRPKSKPVRLLAFFGRCGPVMREKTMQIRAITRDEISCIRTLWENLNAYHLLRTTDFKDHFSTFTFEKRIQGLERRDSFIAYVAEVGNESVGYCIATVDGLIGEIDSIFVNELNRGKGIGEKLISLALEWLKGHECETIKVSIAKGNENVLNFYRKFGFAERMIVMQKKT
jgi:ribosomal protein S18 acetylase RimI-like enzyme